MTFTAEIPLRWSDLDAQGHVNNALVVDYLQEARVAFLRSGIASPLLDSGVVVVGHRVEYRSPIAYADVPVRVELGVSALGGARIELAYRVLQDGKPCVNARTVLTPFNFNEQRPQRLSPEHRAFFDAHRIEAEALRPLAFPPLGGVGTPVPLAVRWTDLDSYGHVNNAKVFDFLQQARVTATTAWVPAMARAGAPGSERMWLVARQDVDYLVQLPHRMEPFEVRVAPVAVGTTSLTVEAEVTDPADGTVFARGVTVLVSADAHGRPTPLGPELTLGLERHTLGHERASGNGGDAPLRS